MSMLDDWQDKGYLHFRSFFEPEHVARLLEIANFVTDRYLKQGHPVSGDHVLLGAFPSVVELEHPGHYEGRVDWWREMTNLIASPRLRDIWREVSDEEPIFAAASIFVDPPLPYEMSTFRRTQTAPDGAGRWHRDVYEPIEDDEVEKKQLLVDPMGRNSGNTLVYIPLVPSDAFELVVGSHRRWDTPQELIARKRGETMEERTQPLPGAYRPTLRPGDLFFVNVDAIHRGWYTFGEKRRTIVLVYNAEHLGSLRSQYRDEHGIAQQAWMLEPGALDDLDDETREFFERFAEKFREPLVKQSAEV